MKGALIERSIVVILFVLVLVVFSFAERDTRKLVQLHPRGTVQIIPEKPAYTADRNIAPVTTTIPR